MRHLAETDLVFLDGAYLYATTKEGATTSLTLVPPSTYGPPEKCFIDAVESDRPGIVWQQYGEGQSAYFPWNVDGLYYRHSSPGHHGAVLSALSTLVGRAQLLTDANPQVDLALYARETGGYVLNLVNTSGHHGTAFFAPIPMHDLKIEVTLPTEIQRARSLSSGEGLALSRKDGYVCLRLGRLGLFDTIVLE
jgi:hypothetical protein